MGMHLLHLLHCSGTFARIHLHPLNTHIYVSVHSLTLSTNIHTSLPLLPVFIVCLHTTVHDPVGCAAKHHIVSIQAVPAKPGHGAVFPHVAPGLNVLLLAPQTYL